MKKMIGICCCTILYITASMVAAPPAFSDEKSQHGVYTLGEVVVSASKGSVEKVSTVRTVTAADIKRNGAQNLSDVLETIPGISIRVGGAGTPRVDIRGFRTRHVQLLLDGIPINDTYDGQFDPTTFPVEHIAAVKVITGGASVLYGPGGIGGVINIISKKGTQGIQGLVGAEFGPEAARTLKASLSGGTQKFDMLVSVNQEKKDAFPLSDDFESTKEENGGARENSDIERESIFANMGYAISDTAQLGATLNWYQGENGVPPRINSDKDDPFNKKPKYDRVDDQEGFSAQMAFNVDPDNPWRFRGWAYRNQQDMLENRYDDDTYATQEKKGAYEADSQTAITGVNMQVAYDHKNWLKGTVGIIAERHDWESSQLNIKDGGKTSTTESDEDIDITTLALEFEIAPGNDWGVVLGASRHFMEGNDIDSDNDTSLLLGARYDVTENTRVTASYTRKIRFPSLRQLYGPDEGNADLDAEKTDQYEIGLTQALPGRSQITLTGFYAEAKDYIEKIDDGTGTDVYRNFEEYLFRGMDITAETRCIDNLLIRASYAYLHSEDQSDDTEREELQYRPRSKYYLEGTYTFNMGLMLHGDVLVIADQYDYDADNKPPLLKRKLNDYTVVGAKISQRFMKDTVEVYVRAENLLDEDYEQSYDMPQAGRTVFGGCEIRF